MVFIDKIKLQAHLRTYCIDVEKMCERAKINRNNFYCYLNTQAMPKSVYKKLCKTLNKSEKEFLNEHI